MSEARLKEIKALHGELFVNPGLLMNIESHSYLHRFLRVMPRALELSLVTLESLSLASQFRNILLDELLAFGEDGEVHHRMLRFRDILAWKKVEGVQRRWDSVDFVTGVNFEEAYRDFWEWVPERFPALYVPGNSLDSIPFHVKAMRPTRRGDPWEIAELFEYDLKLNFAHYISSFIQRNIGDLDVLWFPRWEAAVMGGLVDLLAEECKPWEMGLTLHPHSLTGTLMANADHFTRDKVLELDDVAREYNLEWALASFEWAPEGNSAFQELKGIMNDASWSDLPLP